MLKLNIKLLVLDKPARLIVRLLFGFVSDSETSVATPWERLRNLWWASVLWKLVATHFFWWISPPICFETCLQPKRITEVHHKVSKNALKVEGWLTNCLKFGKPVIWICFEVKSDFFSLETSIWTSHWDCLKFGKTFTWICLEVKSYFFRIRNQQKVARRLQSETMTHSLTRSQG